LVKVGDTVRVGEEVEVRLGEAVKVEVVDAVGVRLGVELEVAVG